jgi:uncharacterized protein YdeI (BOF family)
MVQEKFEDTNGVIRIRIPKENWQYRHKIGPKENIDLQNTTQKLKIQ